MLVRQGGPIPVFVKRATNAWEYAGRFRVKGHSTDPSVLAAKARALSEGRYHVAIEDLAALALPVLRHRVLANYQAESDGVTVDDLLERVVKQQLGA